LALFGSQKYSAVASMDWVAAALPAYRKSIALSAAPGVAQSLLYIF
jgi:hypothetical protein